MPDFTAAAPAVVADPNDHADKQPNEVRNIVDFMCAASADASSPILGLYQRCCAAQRARQRRICRPACRARHRGNEERRRGRPRRAARAP
ncbi:hypothetical protein AURDEDRAFT_113700 [Auricularia subglabra TFB-10046 SS5]|nr:hypothetical protein AURDEDRAFT_113700 [Auricularia subglabra TFB-10046 SS5]